MYCIYIVCISFIPPFLSITGSHTFFLIGSGFKAHHSLLLSVKFTMKLATLMHKENVLVEQEQACRPNLSDHENEN